MAERTSAAPAKSTLEQLAKKKKTMLQDRESLQQEAGALGDPTFAAGLKELVKKNQGQLAAGGAGADKIQGEDNMKKILAGLNEESQLESKKEGEEGDMANGHNKVNGGNQYASTDSLNAQLNNYKTDAELEETNKALELVSNLWDDSVLAFEMLDKDMDGFISWTDARYWLRCIGWTCTDQEMDEVLLASVTASSQQAVRISSGSQSADDLKANKRTKKFSLQELQIVAGGAKEGRLASESFLGDRLNFMCGSTMIDKEALTSYMTTTGEAMREDDLEELMKMLGYGSYAGDGQKIKINVNEFSNALVGKILQPPNIPVGNRSGRVGGA